MKENIFDLTGQVAFVVGASSGLGAQFARALANAGADLVLVARRVERLEAKAKELEEEFGVKCYPHRMDLMDSASISEAVKDALEHFGKIDILVNSGGIGGSGDSATMTDEAWLKVINADLNGQYFVMREVARQAMIPANYGRIINVASIHAFIARKGVFLNAYCAAKGGLSNLAKALANDWAKYNITVNCIAPGYFATELTQAYINTPEFQKLHEDRCPMERPGRPGEMDGICVYFASPACSYTTGQTLCIDGGWTCV